MTRLSWLVRDSKPCRPVGLSVSTASNPMSRSDRPHCKALQDQVFWFLVRASVHQVACGVIHVAQEIPIKPLFPGLRAYPGGRYGTRTLARRPGRLTNLPMNGFEKAVPGAKPAEREDTYPARTAPVGPMEGYPHRRVLTIFKPIFCQTGIDEPKAPATVRSCFIASRSWRFRLVNHQERRRGHWPVGGLAVAGAFGSSISGS